MNLDSLGAVALIDAVLVRARLSGTSDIHIDPGETCVRIRIRIDGVLQELSTYRKELHGEVVSRIKVLAGLKLDEHYIPQDGRFQVSGAYDVRVATAPAYFGEAIVMRLLRPYDSDTTFHSLGFSSGDSTLLQNTISRHSGMILVAGPTGSGKTTTLYTLLRETLSTERSVITIEDPIEYILHDARQIAVRGEKMNFARVLRSVLRQDPNVLMVGEMRDAETARVAISAALTGHLVLSTIHTRSAEETRIRLMDMGIEKYLIDSAVSVIIAQRLVRRICSDCAQEYEATDTEKDFMYRYGAGQNVRHLVRGVGCDVCGDKGYRGRMVLYEILFPGTTIPVRTYIEDGIEKAIQGVISLVDVMALA